MLDPDRLRHFVREYEEYARRVLRPNQEELKRLFKAWKDPNHWARHTPASRLPAPSPVQRAISRIKRPESVVDKILRKPTSFPEALSAKSIDAMNDTLGGRAIVYFLQNLPLVDQELRESDLLEISSIDPPTAYLTQELAEMLGLTKIRVSKKESGYASLHYTVRFRPTVLIDGQLKLLTSRGIQAVGELRENATAHRLELIRRTYREYRDRTPTDFETVAGVAAIRGLDDDEAQVADAIKGQIDILDAWLGLKKEIRKEDAA